MPTQIQSVLELLAQKRISSDAALQLVESENLVKTIIALVTKNEMNAVVGAFILEKDVDAAGRMLLQIPQRKTTAVTTPPRPRQRRTRETTTQNVITVERHFEIVRVAQELGIRAAARRLGYPPETVANQMRYAGLIPIPASRVHEIETWRQRRNLYLDRPLQIREVN